MGDGNKKAIPSNGEILLYQAPDGTAKLNVRLVNETLWLSLSDMATLFDCSTDNISFHLKNIFESGELNLTATTEDFSVVRQEGSREVRRMVTFYNLDAIISVGYRVNSIRGTQFRIWATQRLKEYIVKGFVLDDERLKNPPIGDNEAPDYFDELLERIRDIRASERRMYLWVREIFSMAADYRIGFKETTQFFTFIQDKLHVAATGKISAELIMGRADHLLPNMGLTNHPTPEIRKVDVTVGRNYLNEDEITELNLNDWTRKLDEFLRFNDREVLQDHGKISRESANAHAHREYELFVADRRGLKEAEGERQLEHDLEEIAKRLPVKRKRNSQVRGSQEHTTDFSFYYQSGGHDRS